MRKKIFGIMGILLVAGVFCYFKFLPYSTVSKPKTIGIVMPIEHRAFQEIIDGFQQKLNEHFKGSLVYNVQSAQGDLKLQRSIIEMFIGQRVDLIVPLGTGATQMALSLVKDQPIVSLAALYSERARAKRHPKNVTGVLDEVGGKKKLDFIKEAFPNIHIITLLFHGGNEKTFQEVEEISHYGKQIGITVQTIMVQNLIDIESAIHGISKESQAILILKDSLLASGIRMLVSAAKKLQIPLITGDDGTVLEGATLGLGVRESKIGEEGALLAIKVLEGDPIARLPIQEMQDISIFYNPNSCKMQNIDLLRLQKYAREKHYSLIAVGD